MVLDDVDPADNNYFELLYMCSSNSFLKQATRVQKFVAPGLALRLYSVVFAGTKTSMLRINFDVTSCVFAIFAGSGYVMVTPLVLVRIALALFAEGTTIVSSAGERSVETDLIALPSKIDAVEVKNDALATATDTDRQQGVTEITLVDSLDKEFRVELTTKEVITLAQHPPCLPQEDLDFIHDHGFTTPSCRDGSVVPDILIGIDYYWDVISPEAPICLPSGMVLSHTRFGTIVSGNSVFWKNQRSSSTPHQRSQQQSRTKTPSRDSGRSMH
ncbi:unnamed protein product [Heligmosomoides polygyrus]|uniref:DUF1758 domain-containing protein n=1 Tax=Heligmosomoides polygyrus TaxID=6339 RepID=A0A183F611_HELPZ|nr:unnamed protein product [Heligmosomoides polygyrus]